MTAPDFIEVYPDAIDVQTCQAMLAHFEASGQASRGAVGGGVDTRLKDSWDILISGRPDWAAFHAELQAAAFAGLAHYVMKYRYTLLAPMALTVLHPETGEPWKLDERALDQLPPALFSEVLRRVFRPGTLNVQKYLADEGGYPYWHCEHYPKPGTVDPLHRVLLYTVYLNDGFTEGETEFFYQERKIVPRAGSLLIAPAFFTHTHRGNRPRGRDKYIATSWILFQTNAQLYGG